jgi:hypothetical protein
MEYMIKDNTIIFSPEFNKPFDSELLLNYKKIIFSNFTLNYSLYEAYENKNFKNLYTIVSKFNQILGVSLDKLTSLTHLTFGYSFNCQLSNSLDKLTLLTHLTFGGCFDCPLSNSLSNLTSLTHLTFGWAFNNPLANSLDKLSSLTHLTFGYRFNQPLIKFFDNKNFYEAPENNSVNFLGIPLTNSLDKLTSLTH